MVGLEAQEISVALLKKTLVHNNLQDRVSVVQGDMRHTTLPHGAVFDLITGSPPYLPEKNGRLSPHPQRAACRSELRGSVIDYAATAKQYLAPGGRFVYVMLSQDPRTEAAAKLAGLSILEKVDYVFRDDGRKPHICTIVCCHGNEVPAGHQPVYRRFVVRTGTGEPTEEYKQFQAYHMGNASAAHATMP